MVLTEERNYGRETGRAVQSLAQSPEADLPVVGCFPALTLQKYASVGARLIDEEVSGEGRAGWRQSWRSSTVHGWNEKMNHTEEPG